MKSMIRDLSFLYVLHLAALFAILCLGACGKSDLLQSAQGSDSQPLAPPAPVAVEPVRIGSIASYYSASATLAPNKEAEVPARVSGMVLNLSAEEGDLVKEGQVLLTIEEEAYLHRLRQAEAEETKLRASLDRQSKMIEQDLISAEEYESAQNDLKSAEAARALAALELSYARVTAPFSGRVIRRYVDPGQMVNNGTALYLIADLERLLARVHIPAKVFRSIRAGQPVALTLDSNKETLSGEIILVSPVIDATSGTIKVTVAVDEASPGTRPGDFAEVRIETERHQEALLVPNIAVFTDKGERICYIALDGKAKRCPVEVGFQDEQRCEILSGLAEGDAVVVQGQRSLKEGQPLKILDPIRFEMDAAPGEES